MMEGLWKCGIYIQCHSLVSYKEKWNYEFAGKRMELEKIMWSELRSKKISISYLPYVDASFESYIILSWNIHRSQGTRKGP